MSLEFFEDRIREAMRQRGVSDPDPNRHQFKDFMKAVAEIDTAEHAKTFFEGTVEWEETVLDRHANPEDAKHMILYALDLYIHDAEMRASKRMIWLDAFGELDSLIRTKDVVRY